MSIFTRLSCLLLIFSLPFHSIAKDTEKKQLIKGCKKFRPNKRHNDFYRTTHIVAACNVLKVNKVNPTAARSPKKIDVCIFRAETGNQSSNENKEIELLGYVEGDKGKLYVGVGAALDYGNWPMTPAKETDQTIKVSGGHNGGSGFFIYDKKNNTLMLSRALRDPKVKKTYKIEASVKAQCINLNERYEFDLSEHENCKLEMKKYCSKTYDRGCLINNKSVVLSNKCQVSLGLGKQKSGHSQGVNQQKKAIH